MSSALRAGRITKQVLEEYGQESRRLAWPRSRNARIAIRLGDQVAFQEKRREDDMRREGAGMSRWIWRDLEESRQPTTVRQIDSDVRESRRRYGHNRTIIA